MENGTFIFLFTILIGFCVVNEVNSHPNRTYSFGRKYLYLVSLSVDAEHRCTGVLYASNYVLTVGSCICSREILMRKNSIVAVISNKLASYQSYGVDSIICHPKSKDSSPLGKFNDLAIVVLQSKVDSVKSNQLLAITSSKPYLHHNCFIYTWTPNKVQEIYPENFVPSSSCESMMDITSFVPANVLCVVSNILNFQYSDMGAPLICNKELVGLFSWNYRRPDQHGATPYVFTELTKHQYFLNGYIKKRSNLCR